MTSVAPCRALIVVAASRHGGTRAIADRLASTLETHLPLGWRVVRPDLCDLRVLDDADAVVIGSATNHGHWMRSAAHALAYVKNARLFDLWLFSTGPVSDVGSENAQVISADAMVEAGQANEHKMFGGLLEFSRLSWVERAVVKTLQAISADRGDWDEVDDWAREIAQQLSVMPDTSHGTKGTSDEAMS